MRALTVFMASFVILGSSVFCLAARAMPPRRAVVRDRGVYGGVFEGILRPGIPGPPSWPRPSSGPRPCPRTPSRCRTPRVRWTLAPLSPPPGWRRRFRRSARPWGCSAFFMATWAITTDPSWCGTIASTRRSLAHFAFRIAMRVTIGGKEVSKYVSALPAKGNGATVARTPEGEAPRWCQARPARGVPLRGGGRGRDTRGGGAFRRGT